MAPLNLGPEWVGRCGLYILPVPMPGGYCRFTREVPLRGVSVAANLVDFAVEVKVTQTYYNSQPTPLEAFYLFPLDDRAAVSGFEVNINGQITQAHVEEKHEARAQYDRAIAMGDQAQLLEQKQADVFQMTVGNLAPGSTCVITITYVADLKIEGDDVRFLLPTAVAPRYNPWSTPNPVVGSSSLAHTRDGLELAVECRMGSAITRLHSPTHPIQAQLVPGSCVGTVVLNGQTHLAKDFVLLVRTATPHMPRLFIETSADAEKTTVAMITLAPQIELNEVPAEFVFIVDRSGSMAGSNISSAQSALQLFLKSLPVNCYFNIVGFGSRFEKLWPKSQKYSAATLKKATDHVSRMKADLGGTEILKPLTSVFGEAGVKGYARQVFVLTDGQVGNTDQVVAAVGKQKTRCFALGLGASASHALVEGIARAGKGTAEFVMPGQRLETKVIQQLKAALQPSITDVTIDWGITGAAPATGTRSMPAPTAGAGLSHIHAHPLVRIDNPYRARQGVWVCDQCSAQGDTYVWHCHTCSFDMCDDCHAAAVGAVPAAPGGPVHQHPLALVPNPYAMQGLTAACDKCNTQGHAYVHHCGECSFDLCDPCYKASVESQFLGRSVPATAIPQPPVQDAATGGGVFSGFSGAVGSLLGFRAAPTKPAQPAGAYIPAPYEVPPIFSGHRFLAFAMLRPGVAPPTQATINANTPDGPVCVTLNVLPTSQFEGNVLHRLAARALIRDLEDGQSFMHKGAGGKPSEQAVRNEIVRLGKKYNLASSQTSFVAVEPGDVSYGPIFMPRPRPMPVPMASASNFFGGGGGFGGPKMATSFGGGGFGRRKMAAAAPQCYAFGASESLDGLAAKAERLQSNAATFSLSSRKKKASGRGRGGGGGGRGGLSRPSAARPTSAFAFSDTAAHDCYDEDDDDERMEMEEDALFAAAPSATTLPSGSSLNSLVGLQSFDGSFQHSHELVRVLQNFGLGADVLEAQFGLSKDAWATVVVLAVFEHKLASLRDDWELVALKATSWLHAQADAAAIAQAKQTVATKLGA